MARKPIKARVTIRLDTPFHVGGGFGESGVLNYLHRNSQGEPVWPGSAFRGKARHYAQQLLYAVEGIECLHHAGVDQSSSSKNCGCLVCDMFGDAGNARGNLFFSDLRLSEPDSLHIDTRMGNAIDRARRTARDNSLFQIETASTYGESVLVGKIEGTLREDLYSDQQNLLEAAIKAIAFIGGNTGRGLGWVCEDGIEIKWEYPDENTQSLSDSNERAAVDSGEHPLNQPTPHTTAKVVLTTKSPLLIGGHSTRSNYRRTQPFISGGVIRASLAREIVTREGSSDTRRLNYVTPPDSHSAFPNLRQYFGELQFSFFLPQGCRVAPLTAKKCKYGCSDNDSSDSGKPDPVTLTYDTLIATLNNEPEFRCPKCKGRTERVGLFCDCENQGIVREKPVTELVTKSAIDKYRGTSKDEMLFSLEAIVPETVFEGTISGSFTLEELEKLVADDLRIGGRLTSGYGLVDVDVAVSNTAQDTDAQIRKRIEDFNTLLKGNKNSESRDVLIPITLLSDARAVLKEPTSRENEDYLQTYLNALFPQFDDIAQVAHAITQHTLWRGFDTQQKGNFLKDTALLIKAGSVFVLQANGINDDLLDRLLKLEEHGICPEEVDAYNGYGQVRVADEFHIERAVIEESFYVEHQ
jgi:CRISPR-associated Csx10 family RAMP protein